MGATQESATRAFPVTPLTPVGAPGVVSGLNGFEATDGLDVPIAFVAVTVKV